MLIAIRISFTDGSFSDSRDNANIPSSAPMAAPCRVSGAIDDTIAGAAGAVVTGTVVVTCTVASFPVFVTVFTDTSATDP